MRDKRIFPKQHSLVVALRQLSQISWCDCGFIDSSNECKFFIAQLANARKDLPQSISDDEYLSLYLNNRDANLVSRIQDYWLNLAQRAFASSDYPEAYRLDITLAGISATSMPSYRKILDLLFQSSQAAGWACERQWPRLISTQFD